MRLLKLMLVSATLAAGVSPALAGAASGVGVAAHSTYAFVVLANSATATNAGMMASPGDRITVSGGGTFDVAARTVNAAGVFVHRSADGAIHCQGTWWATDFTSFVSFGADPRGGPLGGVLSVVLGHHCTTMGMTMTGMPMTVTSTLRAPAGSVRGTTVGDFTQPLGGAVAIWPQP